MRKTMKMLTRPEELILLSVLRLKEEAYCVSVFDDIQSMTGQTWTLGSIYPPLYRLEQRGLLESRLGEPTAERGGKRKRYYRVTREGLQALQEMKRLHEASWKDINKLAYE